MNHHTLKHGSETPDIAAVQRALETVVDPEIPVLTICDLGVLRDVKLEGRQVVVTITPTYSGCPAMVEISESIEKALKEAGVTDFRVDTRLSPAWTTDWMSEEGREKLRAYGIAPPQRVDPGPGHSLSEFRDDVRYSRFREDKTSYEESVIPERPKALSGTHPIVPCPQCGSEDTRLISEFGSTACKAMYQCNTCLEPFDHFKCH